MWVCLGGYVCGCVCVSVDVGVCLCGCVWVRDGGLGGGNAA